MEKIGKDEAIQWYAQNRGLFKKLTQKIHNIAIELLEEANITAHAITNRTKEIDSFKNKIDNPKYDDPINQISDFSGIRIIAYVEDDLKPICKIIEETFSIDKKNSADKSDELGTDKVGYKSIHYICKIKDDRLCLPEYKKFKGLKFEIQIRTILQHAWAEIEHDRNYKFNGVLPLEIKRRFKILAGSLELMDREFNSISKEIDIISKKVSITDKKDDLKKVEINSTTLKSFLSTQFKDLIRDGVIDPTLDSRDVEVIKELHNFGVKTLNDLNEIIPQNAKENLIGAFNESHPFTFVGLIRLSMIISNPEIYFTKSWTKNWAKLRYESGEFLKKYIDIKKLQDEFNIIIVARE